MSESSNTANNFNFNQIATIHSPYKQKFAIPRQPGLVSAAQGSVEFLAPFNDVNMIRDIEQYSHLWLVFVFHQTVEQGWKPLVRPPRLGGNKKTGVFSTRSPFRPNAIGMSVVKLDEVICTKGKMLLKISGLDLLDGTPILDIKPYIPYSDSVIDANAGMAINKPDNLLQVEFSINALQQIKEQHNKYPMLETLILQVLQQDPRPAYKQLVVDNKTYIMTLYDFNISWQVIDNKCVVIDAVPDPS